MPIIFVVFDIPTKRFQFESHSYIISLPAKPWNSELVSPNVAKILAKRRDRVRAVFERRLARIDRVRPKFLKRDNHEKD